VAQVTDLDQLRQEAVDLFLVMRRVVGLQRTPRRSYGVRSRKTGVVDEMLVVVLREGT
jgi:hypothetical protein